MINTKFNHMQAIGFFFSIGHSTCIFNGAVTIQATASGINIKNRARLFTHEVINASQV